MKITRVLPALVLGLSISSVALAKQTEGRAKRAGSTKTEKHVREAKVKMKKSEMR